MKSISRARKLSIILFGAIALSMDALATEETSSERLACIPPDLKVDKNYYFRFNGSRAEILMRVKEIPGDSCWIKVKEKFPDNIPETKFAETKTSAYWINAENLDSVKLKRAVEASDPAAKRYVPEEFRNNNSGDN